MLCCYARVTNNTNIYIFGYSQYSLEGDNMSQENNTNLPYKIATGVAVAVATGATLLYLCKPSIENNYEISGNQAPVIAGNTVKGAMPVSIVDGDGTLQVYLANDKSKKMMSAEGFLDRLNASYDARQERKENRRQTRHENQLEEIARETELRNAKQASQEDSVTLGDKIRTGINNYDARRANDIYNAIEIIDENVHTYSNE